MCKQCCKERDAAYKAHDPEKVLEQKRAYRRREAEKREKEKQAIGERVFPPEKECKQCGRVLDRSTKDFHQSPKNADKLKSICKQCCKENAESYKAEDPQRWREQKQHYNRKIAQKRQEEKEARGEILPPDKKRCAKCQRVFDRTPSFFHHTPTSSSLDGLTSRCKECRSEEQTTDRGKLRKEMKAKGLKRCTGECRRWLPMTTEYFHAKRMPHRPNTVPLVSTCKECANKKNKENPWSRRNPERSRQIHRRYEERHKEWLKERAKVYRVRYRDHRLAHTRNYRALKRLAEGTHTKEDIFHLFTAQRGKCYYCGKKLTPPGKGKKQGHQRSYQVDHIVPLSRGGRNDRDNLVLACPPCNESKGGRLLCEWIKGGRLL